MLIPYSSKFLIDDVIKNNNLHLLKIIIIVILGALVIQSITSFLLVHILSIKAQEKIAHIRTQFFNKITYLPISYVKDSGTGQLTSRTLDDFESIRVLLGTGLVQVMGGILSVIFALSLMIYLNAKLTLYILTPLIFFGIIVYFIYKKLKPAFKKRKAIRASLANDLVEVFRNIKMIKGFNSNDFSTNHIGKGFYTFFQSIKSTIISANLILSAGILFIGLISIMIMWFGSNMVINHEITIGELTTFTMYLAFLVSPIYEITKASSQYTDANASIERINEILQLENEEANPNGVKIDTNGNIIFKDVNFSYNAIPVLSDISFEIKPNTINAFVGKSGSGKTTLTDLIAAFYQPNSGKILVENNDLSSVNLSHYRQQLGFVFQETFLFNGSIKENVMLAKPDATNLEIETAMNNANVSEFLTDLPDGINSLIGENGSNLSEGQKQRIAIARAFLANPKILILDEATSNLDAYNEKLINESIVRLMKNRTIIVIAHRLNTIKNAHQIIFLDGGKVIETGTHQELIDKKGKYYNLYNTLY